MYIFENEYFTQHKCYIHVHKSLINGHCSKYEFLWWNLHRNKYVMDKSIDFFCVLEMVAVMNSGWWNIV